MNSLEEIDQAIAIVQANTEALRRLMGMQKSIEVKLYSERSRETRRIQKIIELCMTGK